MDYVKQVWLIRVRFGSRIPTDLGCIVGFGTFGSSLWQIQVEINRLDHDQEQREPSSRSEGVRGEGCDARKPCAERWSEGEGDTEARPNLSHGRTSGLFVADIGGDRSGQLHVALTEATNDSAHEKCPEIHSCAPQCDARYVSAHTPEQCLASTILVGRTSNQRAGNCL